MGKRDIFHEGSVHWMKRNDMWDVVQAKICERHDQKLVISFIFNGIGRTEKVRLKDFSRAVRSAKHHFDKLDKEMQAEQDFIDVFDPGYEGVDRCSLSIS